MLFLIKDDKWLEKYNEIWEKTKNNIKKEFESKPVFNKKNLKSKIKPYNGKINANFHDSNNNNNKKYQEQVLNLFVYQ